MPLVTNFTYLHVLLGEKVKKTTEALLHSSEQYNRAKAILKERYGKESEIVEVYVRKIINLPYTSIANLKKIMEFYGKL